ncbi:hypothetical protein ACJX0J_010215 [Zea mays]
MSWFYSAASNPGHAQSSSGTEKGNALMEIFPEGLQNNTGSTKCQRIGVQLPRPDESSAYNFAPANRFFSGIWSDPEELGRFASVIGEREKHKESVESLVLPVFSVMLAEFIVNFHISLALYGSYLFLPLWYGDKKGFSTLDCLLGTGKAYPL